MQCSSCKCYSIQLQFRFGFRGASAFLWSLLGTQCVAGTAVTAVTAVIAVTALTAVATSQALHIPCEGQRAQGLGLDTVERHIEATSTSKNHHQLRTSENQKAKSSIQSETPKKDGSLTNCAHLPRKDVIIFTRWWGVRVCPPPPDIHFPQILRAAEITA